MSQKKTEYNQKKRVRRIQNVNAYTSNSKNIDQEHIKTHIWSFLMDKIADLQYLHR